MRTPVVFVLACWISTGTALATVIGPPSVTNGSTPFSGAYALSNAVDGTKADYASQGAGINTFVELSFGVPGTFDRVVLVQRDTPGASELFKQVTFTHPVGGAGSFTLTDPTPTRRQSPIYTLASPVTTPSLRWDVDTLNSGTSGNTGISEFLFLDTPADAKTVNGVSVIGSATPYNATYAAANAANGVVGFDTPGNEYASLSQGAAMFVEFDLGGLMFLRGFDYIDRFSSADWTNTFTMTFSQNNIFGDGDDIVQSYNKTGSLTASAVFPDTFARYVRLDAVTIAGGANTGVSEMIFYSAVPEPSTFMLAALGLISLGSIGWRRRRRA